MITRLIDKLESRVGRYRGIRNLMTIIVAAMAAVYVADLVLAPSLGIYLSNYLAFDRNAVFHGQVWRLITFCIVPPNQSLLFIVMQLMFIYFSGNLLQNHWGTFRFNLFYFCGLVGSLIAGMITGYASSYYVNLSMLLAVAILYPMMQVNFYGIIPIRMKWLAVLHVCMLIPGIITGSWGTRIAILISLLNVALFFYDKVFQQFKDAKRRYEWKKNWRNGHWR